MLAAPLPGILPPLEPAEALETSMIHSLAGLLDEGGISRARPFRTPHHTASMAAIVGGGRGAKPGEISLAHHGVLFLDELPEFPRTVLETLRQPIETGDVVVARANAHVRYPCRFMLVAAANPCRCGHLADPARACARVPDCGADYLGRISGPLMDRFDLRVEVPPVTVEDLGLPARRRAQRRRSPRASPGARAVQRDALRRPRRRSRSTPTPRATCSRRSSALTEQRRAAARRRRRAASASAPAATTACCASRAPSPTSRAPAPVEKPHVAEAAGYRLARSEPVRPRGIRADVAHTVVQTRTIAVGPALPVPGSSVGQRDRPTPAPGRRETGNSRSRFAIFGRSLWTM